MSSGFDNVEILLKGSNKWNNKKESLIDSFFKDYNKVESSRKVFLSNLQLDKTIYINIYCDVFVKIDKNNCSIFSNKQFLSIIKELLLKENNIAAKRLLLKLDDLLNQIATETYIRSDVIKFYNDVMSLLGRHYLFNVNFVYVKSNSEFFDMIYKHNEMQTMYYMLETDKTKKELFKSMVDNEYILINFINNDLGMKIPYVKFFFRVEEPIVSILDISSITKLDDFMDSSHPLEYTDYFVDLDSAISLIKTCGKGIDIKFTDDMLNGVCVNPKTGLIEDSDEDKLVSSYLGIIM